MPLVLILSLSSITFITMKGSRILITLYAVDMGAGPFETGILFALYGLFPFLLAIAAGRIADRFDNRLLMYWGLGTYTVSLVLPFFLSSLSMLFIVAPVSYGAHVVVPPLFGVIGAAMGVAPIFWTCAVVMGGGSLLNRKPRTGG